MLRTITLLICSAFLLIVSYPQTGWWPLAWIALVPYFFVIDGKKYWASFGWSFLYGFLFFFGTLGWFIYVSYPGAFLLILYISFYIALFGAAFRFCAPCPLPLRLLALPSAWVALEYVRGHLFTGFGWAMLAHSQYQNLPVIQVADITGAYGVSFLVVLVNVWLFEIWKAGAGSCHPECNEGSQKERPCLGMFLKRSFTLFRTTVYVPLLVCLALVYGTHELSAGTSALPTVSVGVVQPNIAQAVKWDPTAQPWIVQSTINLTHRLDTSKIDLIVWPETSLPGVISETPYLTEAIKITARKLEKPILIGAITDENKHYYNSAYLVSAGGDITARYDKIHLVPFGEYFPWRWLFSWVYKYIGLEDFTPGREYTLIDAHPDQDKKFGVLICFEDTLAYLWRDFAKAGAGFLVNMTNDAWFMDTKAPFMHLQAAVFGSVSTRRSLVRAANTGFSGFVDPWGRISAPVEDAHHKKTFVAGTSMARVPIMTAMTFYTKYGDIFTWGCFLVILWAIYQRRGSLWKRKY